ncbi:hypothetical protein GCM10027040_03180 [Halomonas shantousis]
MTRWLLRGLVATSVALVFLVTLTLYWPLPVLANWMKGGLGSGVGWQSVEGHLLAGRIEKLSFARQGAFPLAAGPMTWQVTWPGRLDLTLGEPARAWTLTAALDGLAIDWRLEGGSLSAVDTSQLPLAPTGDWLGRLAVTTRGQRCISTRGALTSDDLALLTPDPIALGQARLSLTCSDSGGYHWQLAMQDPPGLDLTADVMMAANGGGEGELNGRLAEDHPLRAWWRILQPDSTGGEIQHRFGW